uniref:Glyco_tran_WecB n=1 Tax=uncultured Methylobacterium sp. TaxID=157278 RepID=A0A060CDV9_9HYPH|nr:Glyco_tran_WecB [uncultured Methylobacterium sp.]
MPRANILGVGISAVNLELALAVIDQWIAAKTPNYVCVTPVHSVMDCYADAPLRAIYNRAGMVTPDGMPIVWLTRAQGYDHVQRVYGPDLMLALCEHSVAQGYRHYFYGGAEGWPTN